MGCGEFSYGFDGLQLSNDGSHSVAGPFEVELAEGSYDVIFQSSSSASNDTGESQDNNSQQWFVVLDSGYVSPVTSDITDDASYVVDVFEGQAIATSTSMTLQHVGGAGPNIVDPICVGFTPSREAVQVPDVPVDDSPIQIAGPVLTTHDSEVIDSEVIASEPAVEVESAVEVAPVVESAAAVENLPTVAATVVPSASLALTAPTSMIWWFVGLSIGFAAFGAWLLRRVDLSTKGR